MIQTWHKLKLKYVRAGVVFGGDANDLEWESILKHDKSLRQIVKDPTRGKKTRHMCDRPVDVL